MSFIITKGKQYVSRMYIGRFMARDSMTPLERVYGGHVSATGALEFDTKEQAEEYIKRENIVGATAREYNTCCNYVEG